MRASGWWILIVVPAAAAAGEPEPGRPVDSPGWPGQWQVSADALVQSRRGNDQQGLGPGLPGELCLQGTVVPGLTGDQRREGIEPRGTGAGAPGIPADTGISPAERLVVVVDPGHGGNTGSQNGALGPRGSKEKSVTWGIAQRLHRELSRLPGVEVVMTRVGDEDVSMADRVALANAVGADLFLSIHANGSVHSWYHGLETFFHSVEASSDEARRVANEENAMGGEQGGGGTDLVATILQDMRRAEILRDSSRLATLVHEQVLPVLGFPDHGVMQADFYVLRLTRMPAVLIEVGFITNPEEEQAIREVALQEKVAAAMREAVVAYRQLLLRKQNVEEPP